MGMPSEFNTRILIVDDEEIVRDSVREILMPPAPMSDALNAAEAALYGDESTFPLKSGADWPRFLLDFADNGRRALDAVLRASSEGRPYAAIFLDMRMPGWDGLETAERIRHVDQAAEIIFITAFSDRTIVDVVERVGANVGYRCKPFMPEEIRQLATKCVYDWNKLRGLERLIELTSSLAAHAGEVNVLLGNVLNQVTHWLGSSSALLVRLDSATPVPVQATGKMLMHNVANSVIQWVKTLERDTFQRRDGFIYFPLEKFAIAAIIEDDTDLRTEKLYLLRLFLHHAATALENARLQSELARATKLSAVGMAMSKVIHDLRQPVTVIKLEAHLAADETDPVLRKESFKAIELATEETMAYLTDILDFTSNAPVRRERISVLSLLSEVARKAKTVSSSELLQIAVSAPDGLTMTADGSKLGRTLINLVNNAIEAMLAAGSPSPCVILRATESESRDVRIDVQDNGPGIPAAISESVFEPFVTHGKSAGSGLGLAIAKQLVEAHGGSISFESSSRGTVFHLDFAHRPAESSSV